MKRIIIVIICMCSLAFADPLTDYISKFDKDLAIDQYELSIETNGENANILAKLAGLYKDTG